MLNRKSAGKVAISKENDLAVLESELPRILSASPDCCNDPATRKRWEMVKEVLGNLRRYYGPPMAARSHPISD